MMSKIINLIFFIISLIKRQKLPFSSFFFPPHSLLTEKNHDILPLIKVNIPYFGNEREIDDPRYFLDSFRGSSVSVAK